jgi:surfactin synthase thioesterase subunit
MATSAISEIDKPVILFGHSLGAWLAYEVARRLSSLGRPITHLFVAAATPPHMDVRSRSIDNDASILAYISEVGGIPEYAAQEPELQRLILPVIRADLKVAATYAHVSDQPLHIPASLLCGIDDRSVSRDMVCRWTDLIGDDVDIIDFKGDHFFVKRSRDAVIAYIVARVRADVSNSQKSHCL